MASSFRWRRRQVVSDGRSTKRYAATSVATVAGQGPAARLLELNHRDRLDLDQELLLHEPVDDEERVRRVFALGEHRRIVLLAPLIELRDILRVHEEGVVNCITLRQPLPADLSACSICA